VHLQEPGRCSKGGSIWIGLILAGAMAIVTIVAVIEIGWLALAPFGCVAVIVLSLLLLTHAFGGCSPPVHAQDRADN
jgi:hypothetical protein